MSEAAEYWENRYRETGRTWSGNVNASLEREIAGVAPGTALDLGSGEGGDALWLAHNGWKVTAVDIAPTALAVGSAAEYPEGQITWVAADLADWTAPTTYDLVTSCFLHSTVDLPREAILRRAAEAVAPGGLFLTVGHSGTQNWELPAADTAAGNHAHHHDALDLPTPDELFERLFHDNPRLDRGDWQVVTNALV
jgi:SAM-dependent methyltransferase